MIASEFWKSITSSDVMVLFGILALIAGGAALIVSSISTHREAVAQRIKFAMPRTGAKESGEAARGAPPLAILQKLPALGGGLSEVEHREVIRLFSPFGVPIDQAAPYFIGARLILAGILGAMAVAAGEHFTIAPEHWWLPFLAAAGAAIAGWIMPTFFLSHQLKRRARSIASGLPNALELLVVCVEAGLSLEDSLQRVARELQESQPALSDELALTWAEVNILPDRTKALTNLANRTDNPSVRSVVSMLSQSLRFGTPLAQSLRVGATEMRNDQMTHMEEVASRLPALMTIPVMLFIMPTIFLIIGGPAALRLMDMFHVGTH